MSESYITHEAQTRTQTRTQTPQEDGARGDTAPSSLQGGEEGSP